jgi:hypothetical protein
VTADQYPAALSGHALQELAYPADALGAEAVGRLLEIGVAHATDHGRAGDEHDEVEPIRGESVAPGLFGPSDPLTLPGSTVNDRSSTAVNDPCRLLS